MKYLMIAAGIVILLATGSCASPRPSNKFGVLTPVERSIRGWQEENNIDLSEGAFRLLVDQAETECENCTATYHYPSDENPYSVDPPEDASVTASVQSHGAGKKSVSKDRTSSRRVNPPSGDLRRALHDYYLDQLRDINMIQGKRPVIKAADIIAYSFTSFLKDLGFSDEPFGPMGRLIVQSRPRTAFIEINGQRKGYTDKRFVVQAGSHRVKVNEPHLKLLCDTTVVIGDSETKTIVCKPPGT